MTDVTGNGDYLRYSTKELLADINQKIDRLLENVTKGHTELDGRIRSVQERVSIHETLPHHAGTSVVIEKLRQDVEELKESSAAASAVESLTRWLLIVAVGTVGAVAGVVGLFITHH